MAAGTKADAKPNEMRGTLPAGTRLRNYELLSVLGHGGFGITYYAKDTTLGREVAVKEYLPTTLALRENGSTVVPRSTQFAEDFIWGRERFLEEARILATLEGAPAVVRVYDFLEANGTAYMIMGLARGDTLEQRAEARRQAAARDRRAHARPIARRTRCGPQDRLPASRRQARQHHPRCQQQSDVDRFRRVAVVDGRSHGGDDGDLHAALCRGRAADVGQAGTVDRHLRPVGNALSCDHGQAAAELAGTRAQRRLRAAGQAFSRRLCAGHSPGDRCRPDGAGQGSPAVDRGMARRPFFDGRAGQRRDRIRATEASPEAEARAATRFAADEQAAAGGSGGRRFCGSILSPPGSGRHLLRRSRRSNRRSPG